MQIVNRIIPLNRLKHAFLFCLICISILFSSCSPEKRIARYATVALADSSLRNAHVGISIFEPATGKYWYNFNADKYFVPASNTKIPTCYAAMKYLGDSLVAGRIEKRYDSSTAILYPSGDPTFLHPDFTRQSLFKKLQQFKTVNIDFTGFQETAWGSGWSWNDYKEDYMAERSAFPIYGNLVRFNFQKRPPVSIPAVIIRTYYDLNIDTINRAYEAGNFRVERVINDNIYIMEPASTSYVAEDIPFHTEDNFIAKILQDTLKVSDSVAPWYVGRSDSKLLGTIIHSQPTDSLLMIMMHRSDNFFAEQSLLMVSNEKLGIMSDNKVIDTLLKTDLKGLPQPPRWADGSGLSRYNLFSPNDFVFILNKMKDEFGMDRLKVILPTGGRGTLSSYYIASKDRIFAKTGTLSGVVALSGFFYTKSDKLLIFSVLVNNHHGSATGIRRAVEKFLQNVCNR